MQHSNLTQLTPKKTFPDLCQPGGLRPGLLHPGHGDDHRPAQPGGRLRRQHRHWPVGHQRLLPGHGVVMPLTAFLITRFPTKRLYMAGIGSFLIGLLLSIFAGNFGVMMAGRVIQACGNGILLSAAQVVIPHSVSPGETGGP